MATIINADTSEGLKLTSDTSGELKLQSAGTEIVSVKVNGVDVTGDFTVDTSTLYVDATNNRVGIGTDSPNTLLHAQSSNSGGNVVVATLKNNNAVDSTQTSLRFTNSTSDGTSGGGELSYLRNTGNQGSSFIVKTQSSVGVNTERMRIESDGNVGIGTDSPAHNVEIVATNAGDINDTLQIRNNTTTTGSGSRLRFITSTDKNSDANGASIATVRNGNDSDLVFEVKNSERMRIDSYGNLNLNNGNIEGREISSPVAGNNYVFYNNNGDYFFMITWNNGDGRAFGYMSNAIANNNVLIYNTSGGTNDINGANNFSTGSGISVFRNGTGLVVQTKSAFTATGYPIKINVFGK